MKEPIQMIEEMYVMMSEMKNQISIIDNNMKLLQAKVNAELFSGIVKANAQASLSNNPPSLQQKPSTELSPPQVTIPPEEPREYKGTMVNGKVLPDDGKPLHGVAIRILNSDKKAIKETTTNRAGSWVAQLRPGKYIAKAILNNKPAQFKLFEVQEGQHSLDV